MDVRDDVVEIISGFSLFAGLSTPELDLIARVFEEAWFGEGDRILRQGFTGSSFYIILEGTAVIQVDGKKRESLRPGDFFGEISCLLGVPPRPTSWPSAPCAASSCPRRSSRRFSSRTRA